VIDRLLILKKSKKPNAVGKSNQRWAFSFGGVTRDNKKTFRELIYQLYQAIKRVHYDHPGCYN